jgi:hypothetical protein
MRAITLLVFLVSYASAANAEEFKYHAPGKLVPANSGAGDESNRRIYADYISIPMKIGAGQYVFANSQVWRPGGTQGGDQCNAVNYSMPWIDNFCEQRAWTTPLCPNGHGHQGQDIRPPICRPKAKVSAVAVVDGRIIGVNPYTSSVTLKSARDGTVFLYLHLEPSTIAVRVNDAVKAGKELGRVSNFMNGRPQTTTHLHFEIKQNVSFGGRPLFTNVPPYASLVNAYRKWLGLPDTNRQGVLERDADREL